MTWSSKIGSKSGLSIKAKSESQLSNTDIRQLVSRLFRGQEIGSSILPCPTVAGSGIGIWSLTVNQVDGGSIPLGHLAQCRDKLSSTKTLPSK